jgi:hypothetical protein
VARARVDRLHNWTARSCHSGIVVNDGVEGIDVVGIAHGLPR